MATAALLCAAAATPLRAQSVVSSHPPIAAQQPAAGDASAELKIGSQLTLHGYLEQAIPHLLAAQRAGADPYAAGINLGICYLGTGRYSDAIGALQALHARGLHAPAVDNLLAQAYLGNAQPQQALQAFERAAAATPTDEKLYAYMADACTDHKDYALGLRIIDQGLRQIPRSARLHYEKALFLGRLGRFDEGKADFERAAQLAPNSYIGYLAQVQEALYQDDLARADHVLHLALSTGHRDYRMLSLLGTVLLHEGAMPGQPRFNEARAALEESARLRPDYSATQLALGKLYLMQGRARDAVDHLEIARRLEPENPAVYTTLASAWEMLGNPAQAHLMRRQLGHLLAEKASSSSQTQPSKQP